MEVKESFIKRLLRNNSGTSIKSTFIFTTMILGGIILLSLPVALLYDVFTDGVINSSISDIGLLVGAVAGLFTSAGLPKIVGEINEKLNKNKDDSSST